MMGEDRSGVARALVVSVVLAFALPLGAAQPTPSIDDLDGSTFTVRAKGPEYDLAGNKGKYSLELEITITKIGADTVSFDTVFPGMRSMAYYVDGFLMQAGDTGENPPESGSMTYLRVRGRPGKLKMKGMLSSYSAGPGFNVLRVLRMKAKQLP